MSLLWLGAFAVSLWLIALLCVLALIRGSRGGGRIRAARHQAKGQVRLRDEAENDSYDRSDPSSIGIPLEDPLAAFQIEVEEELAEVPEITQPTPGTAPVSNLAPLFDPAPGSDTSKLPLIPLAPLAKHSASRTRPRRVGRTTYVLVDEEGRPEQ